ncbi:IS30 family transposase [Bifidobacterium pseudocatenulatum]|uniref:IS30 family transposase n=1 Tax=Bifidobacterium pseudocatenulatum TaxID=28026 RepID=UPI000E520365|nr:IS30 family transposase [Bifidobacterium pseudocatenulatum]RHG79446.1 IS30 family transposase [Bifidobacterium pseudocatenulatum]RHG83743.1 IS30 family transposase [Bifidobacterium pseudocatenulatum]RHG96999.1 IS30 family transposase [Bifidobacterium pseudocatenulatum]
MTRSHRNEDRGGERRWTFNGVEYPTRKLMCAARREEYVRLLDEEGMNFTQAAHAVGVSKRTGKAWRNGRTRATGRNEKASMDWYRSAMDKPKRIHARYLNQEERILIADRLRLGDSIRAIARLLGRDPGTVSREVERNRNPGTGDCEPYRAQQKAADRLKRPKPRKAADGTPLWAEILAGLRRHWSPEQISGRLKAMFPDNGDMHASVETIYQAIYLQARGGLKQELKRAMRQGRTDRRPQGVQGRKPRFREPMVMISERPPEIEDRAVPGHWEGDLITGSRNKSAIGTLVERTTGFTILLHLPDGHDAEHVQQAIIDKMASLPKLLRNSLTWDQGAELAPHKRIGASLDMAVYFCDPHSPWQRGTNENTNGLLRQYFPKGTDLSVYPEDYLDAVAEELNDRPRKTLGFMKPSEKIIELLDAA